MDTNLSLRAVNGTVFRMQPATGFEKRSLKRSLRNRFLDWIEDASADAICKAAVRTVILLLMLAAFAAPDLTVRFFLWVARWNGYRVPLFFVGSFLLLNWRRIIVAFRRHSVKRQGANQHTYHGLPVDELATFLCEEKAFKRDDAMRRFGLGQDKHEKIAVELEKHQVLVRGDKNARVLNQITREQLVRQLREKFPLAFYNGEWVERQGSYHLFLKDKEREEQKERERVEKLERRAERAKSQMERIEDQRETASVFGNIMAMQDA